MKLTPKQEKFSQLVADGNNISDAYRQTYDVSKMKPESIHREAHELSNNPKVSSRIKEIQRPVVEKIQITLESHLDDLKALRNMAIKEGKITAAVQAEIARGKAAGVAVERSEVRHELPEVVVRYID